MRCKTKQRKGRLPDFFCASEEMKTSGTSRTPPHYGCVEMPKAANCAEERSMSGHSHNGAGRSGNRAR